MAVHRFDELPQRADLQLGAALLRDLCLTDGKELSHRFLRQAAGLSKLRQAEVIRQPPRFGLHTSPGLRLRASLMSAQL